MDNSEIQHAIEILEKIDSEKAALVVTDSKRILQGNREGLVLLAIASLRAALGEKQMLKDQSWLIRWDLDFGFKGIELDDYAHVYLPPILTRWQRFRNNILAKVAGFMLVICLLVGFATIVIGFVVLFGWLLSLPGRLR
ncbi:MAG: hypothetical protein FWD64_14065 [Acidobacteriaceae bacterium]|nr:hypothetical protein [Acidobacteriaceae bacterium]